MKKILKIVGGIFLVLVVLAAIGSVTGNKAGTNTQSSQNAQPAKPAAPIEATKIDTQTLVGEFDKNKLSATDKYKGQYLEFTAKIKNISEDITGSPYLSLEPVTADTYYFGTPVQCFFKDASPLKTLENGKSVTLRGTNDGMSIGTVIMKDCVVVQ